MNKDINIPSAFDVADFILKQCGEMSCLKLQKLIYYCQAWSLVWDKKKIFGEKIMAWPNGPIVCEMWNAHRGRGRYKIKSTSLGNSKKLTIIQKDTILAVLKFYANMDHEYLKNLILMEIPWNAARKGIRDAGDRSREISLNLMRGYYVSLSAYCDECGQKMNN